MEQQIRSAENADSWPQRTRSERCDSAGWPVLAGRSFLANGTLGGNGFNRHWIKTQPAETPDFFVMIGKRLIGIEITSYKQGEMIGSHGRRQVESEWDKFELASDAFRANRPDLADINAILYFGGSVPPKGQYGDF